MALFGKKEKKETFEFPELPKLPSLDDTKPKDNKLDFPQLPVFPRTNLDNNFLKGSIKDLITGEKEERENAANEFDSFERTLKTMPKPLEPRFELKNFPTKEFKEPSIISEKEPIFVRLDKFKEAHHIFEESKKQLSEITRILEETKTLKEKESETLMKWEREMQTIKNQIEKIDRELFSKV